MARADHPIQNCMRDDLSPFLLTSSGMVWYLERSIDVSQVACSVLNHYTTSTNTTKCVPYSRAETTRIRAQLA
ncbi:hypothetical protein ACHAW6_002328, partial [Cyclotella cf. meneghiniana]